MPSRAQGFAVAAMAFGLSGACQSSVGGSRQSATDTTGVRQEVREAIDRYSAAIARLDAAAVLGGSPNDSYVVYITNGHPIRGSDFVRLVRDHYQRLDSLNVLVENVEIRPLTHDYAASTVWVRYISTDKQGHMNVDSSIVTSTWERASAGWRQVLWQKGTR